MSDTFTVIKSHLEKNFDNQVKGLFPKASEPQRLSMGLAAYAIFKSAGASVADSVESVIDGSADLGVDAFYYDSENRIAYIVQSKVNADGTKGLGKGEALKFLEGVGKILDGDLEKFNNRMRSKEDKVTQFLDTTDGRVCLILISTGVPLEAEIQSAFDEFCKDQNSPEQSWVTFKHLAVEKIKDFILEDKTPRQVDLKFEILNWAEITTPIKCVYGRLPSVTIGEWFETHGAALFGHNIRSFLGSDSSNNQVIQNSLTSAADQFFYLNNGLTILCDDLTFTRGTQGDSVKGIANATNVRIVNGAQTTGSIGEIYMRNSEILKSAYVMARIISLRGLSSTIGGRITVASNTQTKIDGMDFVSIDLQQIRLEKDCLRDYGYQYLRQRGTPKIDEKQISPDEAASSLLCASSDHTDHLIFKRNPGVFWG